MLEILSNNYILTIKQIKNEHKKKKFILQNKKSEKF